MVFVLSKSLPPVLPLCQPVSRDNPTLPLPTPALFRGVPLANIENKSEKIMMKKNLARETEVPSIFPLFYCLFLSLFLC